MAETKDYSLLRPFDAEAAKRGEQICNSSGDALWDYVAGPDSLGRLAIVIKDSGAFINPKDCPAKMFRMAPLVWVEGRPVYKGDVLWSTSGLHKGQKIIPNGRPAIESYGSEYLPIEFEGCDRPNVKVSSLTWKQPKTKREGWFVVPTYQPLTEEDAKSIANAIKGLMAIRHEWEE